MKKARHRQCVAGKSTTRPKRRPKTFERRRALPRRRDLSFIVNKRRKRRLKRISFSKINVLKKTHDLEVLAGLAQPYEIGFSNVIKPAVMLTPYATQFRYPGDFIEPSREEFEEAQAATQKNWEFVLSLVPAEAHP